MTSDPESWTLHRQLPGLCRVHLRNERCAAEPSSYDTYIDAFVGKHERSMCRSVRSEELLPVPVRTVILVGPGKHFGIELVRRFLEGGFRVGVVSVRSEALAAIADGLGDRDDRVLTAVADVRNAEEFGEVLTKMAEALGRVDGLIYNPKDSIPGSALSTQADDLSRALAVNVTGAMVAVQALLPHLEGRRGTVILTGGGYGRVHHPEKFALSVGKAAIHAVYENLREPLRRRGVAVRTVVIEGSVRRAGEPSRSAACLADFYWHALHGPASMYTFPRQQVDDERQLGLFA